MKRIFYLGIGLYWACVLTTHGATLSYEATGVVTSIFPNSSENPSEFAVGDPFVLRFSYDTESYAQRQSDGDSPPPWSVLISGIIGIGATPVAQLSNYTLWAVEDTGRLYTTSSGNRFGDILQLSGEPSLPGETIFFDLTVSLSPDQVIPVQLAPAGNGAFRHVATAGGGHDYYFALTSIRPIPEPSALGLVGALAGGLAFRRRRPATLVAGVNSRCSSIV